MLGKELISADETAELLNVTRRTLLKWAREKKIECVRISKKTILFSLEAIDEFVRQRTHGVESHTTTQGQAGVKSPRSKSKKKGGDKRNSGEMWNDLRKEVRRWQ
jgi:excisionase family DNA binding protein